MNMSPVLDLRQHRQPSQQHEHAHREQRNPVTQLLSQLHMPEGTSQEWGHKASSGGLMGVMAKSVGNFAKTIAREAEEARKRETERTKAEEERQAKAEERSRFAEAGVRDPGDMRRVKGESAAGLSADKEQQQERLRQTANSGGPVTLAQQNYLRDRGLLKDKQEL